MPGQYCLKIASVSRGQDGGRFGDWDSLVMRPGIQAATQIKVRALDESPLTQLFRKTVRSTVMEMMRMLKSIVWTLSWPIQALATHEALGEISGDGSLPLPMAIAPEMVLFKLLIKSRDWRLVDRYASGCKGG